MRTIWRLRLMRMPRPRCRLPCRPTHLLPRLKHMPTLRSASACCTLVYVDEEHSSGPLSWPSVSNNVMHNICGFIAVYCTCKNMAQFDGNLILWEGLQQPSKTSSFFTVEHICDCCSCSHCLSWQSCWLTCLQWRSGRYEQMLCSLKGIIWSAPYLLLVRQFPAVL